MKRYRGVLTQPSATVTVTLAPSTDTEVWLTQPAVTGNTAIASASNGVDPTTVTTINVGSTVGFATSGTIYVDCLQHGTTAITISITYQGVGATTFTGCVTGFTPVAGLSLIAGGQVTGNKQVTFLGVAQWMNDPTTGTAANTVDRYQFRNIAGVVYGQHMNVTGPDGPRGVLGPVGVAHRGGFAPTGTAYSANDIVTYNNNTYICTAAVGAPASAHLPTDTLFWDCIAGTGTAKIPSGAPNVSSVTPNNGVIAGGTVVSIVGFGFTGTTAVTFGATAGTSVTVVDATHITVTSPAHTAGLVDVTVTNAFGTSATTVNDSFTFTGASAPTVTSITPTNGPTAGATAITITGTNLGSSTAVSFGGTAASTFANVNSTTVTATSPAHALGVADVTVTTAVGTSPTNVGDRFTFTASVPTVTSVIPNNGTTGGGTVVTITGTDLTGTTAVTFGGIAATAFANVNATTLSATSPTGAAGLVDVRVTTPAGTSLVAAGDQFTFTAAPPITGGVTVALPWDKYSDGTGGKSATTGVVWVPRAAGQSRNANVYAGLKAQGVTGYAVEVSNSPAFTTPWSGNGTGTLPAEQLIIRDNTGGATAPIPSTFHGAGVPVYISTDFVGVSYGNGNFLFGADAFDDTSWGATVPSTGATATPGSFLYNLRNYAAMARLYNYDGFFWDVDEGHSSSLTNNTPAGKTAQQTRLQIKARGKQMMEAIAAGWASNSQPGDPLSKHMLYHIDFGGSMSDILYAVDNDVASIAVDWLNGFTSQNNWERLFNGNSHFYYGGEGAFGAVDFQTCLWYEENGTCARWSHSLDNWNYAAQRIGANAAIWPGPGYAADDDFEKDIVYPPSREQPWFDYLNKWSMMGIYWVAQPNAGEVVTGITLPIRDDGSGLRSDITWFKIGPTPGVRSTFNPYGSNVTPFGVVSYVSAWQAGSQQRTVDSTKPVVTISSAVRVGSSNQVTVTGTATHNPPGNIPQGIRRIAWATSTAQGHAQHNFVTSTNPQTATIGQVSASWTWTANATANPGDTISMYAESLKGVMSNPAQIQAPLGRPMGSDPAIAYTTQLFDDFNGPTLNSNVWATSGSFSTEDGGHANFGNGQREYDTFDGSNFSFANSVLTITARRQVTTTGVRTYQWTSGQIVSKQAFTDGFFEIYCKLPTAQGFQTAFWQWGSTGDNSSAHNEVDCFEVYSNAVSTVAQTSHLPGSSGETDYHAVNTTGWHKYGYEINAGTIKWYVDGVLTKTDTGTSSHAANLIAYLVVIDDGSVTGTARVNSSQTVLPATTSETMQIDYIAAWTRS